MKNVSHRSMFTLLVLVGALASSASAQGEACTVKFSESANKYTETGKGNTRCGNSLVCMPESDDGTAGQDFPGTCETQHCSGVGETGSRKVEDLHTKVTICHRTCSEKNPWVRITIDDSAWGDASCKHGLHTIENCGDKKDSAAWGINQQDYLIKRHGTKAEVAAMLNDENSAIADYWNHWERACPYVRNGACCSLSGEYGYSCCGGAGDPPAPTPTQVPALDAPVPAPTPAQVPAPTNVPAVDAPNSTDAPVPAPTPVQVPAPTNVPAVDAPNPTDAPVPAPTTPAQVPAPTNVPVVDAPYPTDAPVQQEGLAGGSNKKCSSTTRVRRLQSDILYQRWNISEPTFTYSSRTFKLDFEISDYIATTDQVQITLFDGSCDNAYTGRGLSDTIGSLVAGADGDGKQNVGINVVIDPNTISTDDQVYSEGEERVDNQLIADVDFCVRFSLRTEQSTGNIEVNFLEIVVQLDLDLTDGFKIGSIEVEPLVRCEFEANDAYNVEGFFCEEGNEPDSNITSPLMNQGEVVKICVRPVLEARTTNFIRMRGIESFAFAFENSAVFQAAVVNGEPASNGLTELWCDEGYAICHFETILYAAFYARPGSVIGSGVADMQFGGETSDRSVSPKTRRRRRHLRNLQEGDNGEVGTTTPGAFDLLFTIVPTSTTQAASGAARGMESRLLFALGITTLVALRLF
jgi:hypothetical protein